MLNVSNTVHMYTLNYCVNTYLTTYLILSIFSFLRLRYINSLPRSKTSTWNLEGVQQPLTVNVLTFGNTVKKLTFAHLLEATNGFSEDSLIGSGGFGEVYKAHLKDNNIVAIKKLNHTALQGDREFMAEMETIGRIKHKNLVPLLGYCKVSLLMN